VVLCFTVLDDVKAASQKELQQLWRRGVHKVPLPLMPTKGDLACILKHNGLEFPEAALAVSVGTGRGEIIEKPYEVLRQLAKRDGLKAITERLRYGRKLAARKGRPLDWQFFLDAHLRIAKQAEQEVEDEDDENNKKETKSNKKPKKRKKVSNSDDSDLSEEEESASSSSSVSSEESLSDNDDDDSDKKKKLKKKKTINKRKTKI
jgi:hypothetical protein